MRIFKQAIERPSSKIAGWTAALMLQLLAPANAESQYQTEIVPQVGHVDAVTSVAFSPDGHRVLSGSRDNTVRLWDVATGALVRTFEGSVGGKGGLSPAVGINAVDFSPDGRLVIFGCGDGALIASVAATGKSEQLFFTELGSHVASVAYAPNRQLIFTGAGSGVVEQRNALTGELVRTIRGHRDVVTSLVVSPDGRRLLSGSRDRTVRLWDVETGVLLRTIGGQSGEVRSLAVSSDGGRLFAGNSSGAIEIRNAQTGDLVRTIRGHANVVTSVAISPDGRQVLSGSSDNTVRLWDAETGGLLRIIDRQSGGVFSVAFSPDGRQLLAGGEDSALRLWDTGSGAPVRSFVGYSSEVASVAFSPDGRQIVSGNHDQTVRIWDASVGRLVRTISGHSASVASVRFSPDGHKVLSGSADKTVRLWDAGTGKQLRMISGHSSGITSVSFSPSGHKLLSGSSDASVRLWDAATGKLERSYAGGQLGTVNCVAFSPDGHQVLAGGRYGMNIWDTATGISTFKPEFNPGAVNSVSFSPNGRAIVSAGSANPPMVWDAATGARESYFTVANTDLAVSTFSVAYSPDARQVLTGSSDNSVKLWDVDWARAEVGFWGHSAGVTSVAFSPDGRRVLSGSKDSTTRLWERKSGAPLITFVSGRNNEWLALTPDGFFSASSPDAARLLRIVRGLEVIGIDQIWQSLFEPDLVREKLAGDPNGEVTKASSVVNLDKVLDSGKPPRIVLTLPASRTTKKEVITAEATIAAQEGGGIGRVEWRVNGITVGVNNPTADAGSEVRVKQSLALDPGENTIHVIGYNGRNLIASSPAAAKIKSTGSIMKKPWLHILAIGINNYIDKGSVAPGDAEVKRFPPLGLAVRDAKALAKALKRAAEGTYGGASVLTILDNEASAGNLDSVMMEMAGKVAPRDTFIFYAAAHGYSHEGRFYLIPQDYQGGVDPRSLATRAIDQFKLQEWIVTRVRAKKVLILLDACESGALTSGFARSRFHGPASEAAIGRLHEATGRPVLTAAAVGQSALELTDLGHGVFTSAVIDSLYRGDLNDDGNISLSELVIHVQNLVPRLINDPEARAEVARRGEIGGEQSARFGSRGEDFLLVRRLQ